jgi:SET domain-containing protein
MSTIIVDQSTTTITTTTTTLDAATSHLPLQPPPCHQAQTTSDIVWAGNFFCFTFILN